MKSFLHGLGGGLGRGIGRFIAILAISFLIYFIVDLLDLDVKNDIINRVFMLNVSAKQQTSDVTSSIYTDYNGDCTGGQRGYCALQTNSIAYTRQTKTTYSGVLNALSFELHYVFNSNYQYTLSLNGMSTDFRNNYLSVSACGYTTNSSSCTSIPVTLRYVSKSQLQVVFPQSSYYVYRVVIIGSPLTGVSTYGLKSAILTYDDGATDMSGVIDNQNQNTTDIINNNNSNTEDIIQNITNLISSNDKNSLDNLNNARTSANSTCKNYYVAPINYGKKQLTAAGVLVDSNVYSYYTEQYINIDIINSSYGDRLGIKNPAQAVSGYRFILYDSDFNFISTTNLANRNVVIPSNAQYFRFASPVPSTYIYRGGNCVSSSDETNQLINDDSVDNSQANSFFNDFEDNDHGLSAIITLPLTTIQSLTSKQCVALELPIPFTNETISLPCMSEIYQSKVPGIYNLWQIVCYGLIGYWIGTDIFKLVKGFKDPEEDKIEVVDL